jgi:hypothetical protein
MCGGRWLSIVGVGQVEKEEKKFEFERENALCG